MANAPGTLFLIGTPLGNLEDMTFRAVRVLGQVDELYCEDTRRTQILLKHFKIVREHGPKSFHDHSSKAVLMKIRELLLEGKSIAYATDGGMPVVSDPGFVLVREAVAARAKIEVIPGPSAAVTLFAASAIPSPKYLFHGFFPKTRGEIERVLELVKTLPVAHLFYEGPSRLVDALEIVAKHIPQAQVVLGRELTKLHEEILRGEAQEVLEVLKARDRIRGECAFAVYSAQSQEVTTTRAETDDEGQTIERKYELSEAQKAEIAQAVQAGTSSKDAAKALSKKFGVPRKLIYDYIVRNLT